MSGFYDSDIKIAGSAERETDESTAFELYEFHRSCGNLARARRLGATLADAIEQLDPGERDFGGDETAADHGRILMIFSMVVGIEQGLGDELLVRSALNVFYDTLKKEQPGLYDRMSSSGAYTFYYLEYRRCGNTSVNIGNSFAMLCGREGDQRLASLGKEIFETYCGRVARMIDEMRFCPVGAKS